MIKKGVGFCLIICLLLFLLVEITSYFISYNQFVLFLSSQTEISLSLIQQRFLPSEKFQTVLWYTRIFSAFGFLVLLFLGYKLDALVFFLYQIIQEIKRFYKEELSIKNISKNFRWKIFVLLFVHVLIGFFLIITKDITYDEAWLYNYFYGNKLPLTFFLPHNNHVLFSHLAWISDKAFFFLNPVIRIRIPALIFSIAFLYTAFLFFRKQFKEDVAFYSVCILSVLHPVMYNSFQAKSYSLFLFFLGVLLIGFSSTLNKYKSIFLGLVAALGMYSNPAFIYFLGTLFFLFLKENRKNQLYFFCTTILVTLFLYLPIFISGGFSPLSSAAIAPTKTALSSLVLYELQKLQDFYIGFKQAAGVGYLFFIFLAGILFFRNTENATYRWVFISFLIPFLFLVIQHVYLPDRIFVWLCIPIALLIGKRIELLQNSRLQSTVTFMLFFVFLCSSYINGNMNWSNYLDHTAKVYAAKIQEKKVQYVVTEEMYFKPLLLFYTNKKIRVEIQNLNSMDTAAQAFILYNQKTKNTIPNLILVDSSKEHSLYTKY